MQIRLLLFFFLSFSILHAQLITTDPAAPVVSEALTITFDATQGTAGLEDCDCDVYLHTGVITAASNDGGDWQFVKTTWGVADDAWKLTPVDGQPNKYTYTFSPSIREYFGVPEGTEIEQIALVFRDADGNREGKAAGGQNIFIEVSSGAELAVNLIGDPGTQTYPLGRVLPVTVGTTAEATIELYDNDSLLTTVTGQELNYDVRFLDPGTRTVRVVAFTDAQRVVDSFRVDAELVIDLLSPETTVVTAAAGDQFDLSATAYVTANLSVSDGSTVIAATTDETISETVTLPEGEIITYTLTAAYRGATAATTVTFITGEAEVAEVPAGARPGATIAEDGSVTLHLRAPQKSDVFVVGNFNDWSPVASSRMKRSPNDTSFWLTIPAEALPDDDLLYQYAIDDQGRYADPYATLVLDPNDDPFISEETFSGIPAYPTGAAEGIVTWLRLDAPDYAWQVDDFAAPDPTSMVVYELLVRDFLEDHSYQSLTDTLDYLDRLGINTIELMPVSEFEGNISWGYNPSFHMALDKYYGSPEDLKAFVDAAHARGIAVVLDVVYNHAFGESPLIRMWPGAQSFEPGDDNPYANVEARHPFNVGYDLNHESPLTREYVKVTLEYWLEEFRVDGFRFDLSKGFTQNFSNDVGAWNQYDASRVVIIEEYADKVWSVNDDAYMIMEHLGESREENELAQYGNGMYFWSGFQPHDAYLEASMGYFDDNRADISSVLASERGFDGRNLIAYMESHDEERMLFKTLSFGDSNGDYDVTELPTALDRAALASTFFYTLPGPKMLWQFGELGYDYSINYCGGDRIDASCRTDPKPIVWEYRDDEDRQELYAHISDLLYLRNETDFIVDPQSLTYDLTAAVKKITATSTDGSMAIVGNFDVVDRAVSDPFPGAGTYYDYFSDEEITVTDPSAPIDLAPGEYRLYLTQDLERGGGRLSTGTNDAAVARLAFTVSPNPTTDRLSATFTLEQTGRVEISLLDLTGRRVRQLYSGQLSAGPQQLATQVSKLPAGAYFLRITDGTTSAVQQVIIK